MMISSKGRYALRAIIDLAEQQKTEYIGTNDCKTVYGASEEVIGKGIEKIIGQIKSISPQAKILLISPILLGDDVWKTEYDPEFSRESVIVSKKLKAVYKRIAEKNNCMFLAASDIANPSERDQEHLDANLYSRRGVAENNSILP